MITAGLTDKRLPIEKTDTIIENSIAVRYWQGAVNYLRRSYIIEIKLDKHDYQYFNNRKRTAIGEMNFNQINNIPRNYSTRKNFKCIFAVACEEKQLFFKRFHAECTRLKGSITIRKEASSLYGS